MIKLKRQEKPEFSPFRMFSFRLIIGLIIIAIASLFTFVPSQTSSSSQSAEPVTDTREFSLFNPSLLPTEAPLPSPILPLETIQNFEPTVAATPSSTITPSASPSALPQPEDYCVNVPVILYHHIQRLETATILGHAALTVDSIIFDNQIKYLKGHGYHALTADDLVYSLENRLPIPEKSVLITIDDGYDDNYTYAFLTAKKYQFVMNFMIPSSLIGKPGYMNWDHLREMHASGYAKIYNHTATHAPLGYITAQQIAQELETSNADFERELGFVPHIFTYPYGSYSPIAIDELKKYGFTAGFTTDPGKEECLSNIMLLKRVRVGNASISSYGF